MAKRRISETVSEKRKRGRPRAIPARELALYADPDIKTMRGKQNHVYQTRALSALGCGDDPRFHWLCSSSKEIMAGRGRMRHTILAELGRIADKETLRAVAVRICELKPTTDEARAMIRRARGRQGEPSAQRLYASLVGVLNRYLKRYPSVTWQEVTAAVEGALEACRKAQAD